MVCLYPFDNGIARGHVEALIEECSASWRGGEER